MKAKQKSIVNYIPGGFLLLVVAVIFLASIVPIASADGWNYRRAINITNSGDTLTNYQILVTLNISNFNYSKANADGSDLRFTNYANSIRYNYWIAEWNSSGESLIWVNVSFVPAGDSKMYVWYGNLEASSESYFDNTMQKLQIDSNTVALWHFDEGSGTIVYDETANNNDGTIYGATWQSQDGGQWDNRSDVKFSSGSAMQFDGVDYVEVPDSNSLDIETQSTFEVWLKPNKIGSGMILNKWVDGKEDKQLIINGSGYVYYYLYNIFEQKYFCSNTALTAVGQWYHIAATYDGASAKIYINGVLDNSRLASGDVSDSTGNLHIGYIFRHGVDCKPIDGTIDEIAIYNRALSSEEIKAHYERRKYADPEPTASIGAEEGPQLPEDPIPELPTILLSSIGLLMLVGYVVLRGRNGRGDINDRKDRRS